MIRGRTFQTRSGSGECTYSVTTTIPDFDPVRTQSVQPTALFGAGWVDLISDRAILRNARNRTVKTVFIELSCGLMIFQVGRARMVAGGVGKFGWKGQFAKLEEFVAAACANELGLGTPYTEQAKPLTSLEQSSPRDLDRKQFRSLVSFVKTLPRPVEVVPDQSNERDVAVRGKELFNTVGCAVCHIPDLGGVKGIYSDFCCCIRWKDPLPQGQGAYSEPAAQLQLPDRSPDEPRQAARVEDARAVGCRRFRALSPRWLRPDSPGRYSAAGTGDKAKRPALEKYLALSPADQARLISFLGTLKAPPEAAKLQDPSITRLSRK